VVALSEKAVRGATSIVLLYYAQTIRADGISEPDPLFLVSRANALYEVATGWCVPAVTAISLTSGATEDRWSPLLHEYAQSLCITHLAAATRYSSGTA
jgi:hypothetical protein